MSFIVRMTSPDLADAYNTVRNGNYDVDWALYTYLGNSPDLVLEETGTGGLEAVCAKFSKERVQHAFVRVEDPRMHGDKFILIHWCGQDAPSLHRRFFAVNSGRVTTLLKGAQITVNADEESEIRPNEIMKRLVGHGTAGEIRNVPGANLFRRTTQPAPQRLNSSYTPVGKVDIDDLRKNSLPDVVKPPAPAYTPVQIPEPQPVSNPFTDSPTEEIPPELPPKVEPKVEPMRPTPSRGMTYSERMAAKRRRETLDEERAKQVIQENTSRLNDSRSSLPWSRRKAREDDEASRAKQAEIEEKARRVRELEEDLRRKEETLAKAREDARQRESQQRRLQAEEESRLERERKQREAEEDRLREKERQEREMQEMMEREEELRRQQEDHEREIEYERLARRVQEMEQMIAMQEKENRIKLAEKEKEAAERSRMLQYQSQKAEEERQALLQRYARDEEERRLALATKETLEEELRRKEMEEMEREALMREEGDRLEAELERLSLLAREFELRRDAAIIEQETAQLKQQEETIKRIEWEKRAGRLTEERKRLEAERIRSETALSERLKQVEKVAKEESAAKERAAAAARETQKQLREAQDRIAMYQAQLIEKQKAEHTRLSTIEAEIAAAPEINLEEPDRKLAASPESMTVVDHGAEDKRKRVPVARKQTGWTPLQSDTGFSFERAARSMGTGGNNAREPSRSSSLREGIGSRLRT